MKPQLQKLPLKRRLNPPPKKPQPSPSGLAKKPLNLPPKQSLLKLPTQTKLAMMQADHRAVVGGSEPLANRPLVNP